MRKFLLSSLTAAFIFASLICLGYQADAAAHSNQHITLPGLTVSPNQDLEVKWQNLPGNNSDWIAIVPEGSADSTWGNWWYTGGKKTGTRNAGKLKPGKYEVRVYFNWPAGGYNVQSRLPFTVGDVAAPTTHSNQHITLAKAVFGSKEDITVNWHNIPGSNSDWIAIVPEGSADSTWGNWWYTGGKKTGTRNAGKFGPGKYEIRVYFNWPSGGYKVQSRLPFTVSDATTGAGHLGKYITLAKAVFTAADDVAVVWNGLPGAKSDWIAVVPAGSADSTWGNWWYTDGKASGERNLGKLKPGKYEVRVYFNWPAGGYTVQSRLGFEVK